MSLGKVFDCFVFISEFSDHAIYSVFLLDKWVCLSDLARTPSHISKDGLSRLWKHLKRHFYRLWRVLYSGVAFHTFCGVIVWPARNKCGFWDYPLLPHLSQTPRMEKGRKEGIKIPILRSKSPLRAYRLSSRQSLHLFSRVWLHAFLRRILISSLVHQIYIYWILLHHSRYL